LDPSPRKLVTRDYLLAFFSAVLLTLAFPRFDLEPLAFVALIPLLVASEGLNARQGGWLGFVFGAFWAAFLLYWLSPATTPGFILVVIYQGLFTALFLFLYVAARRFGRLPAAAAAPALWVGMEWLRTVGYLAFPWAIVAHTQYKWNLLIQIADIAGVWPVSLAVVAVNVLAYYILKDYRHVATWLRAGGAAAAILGLLCLYGALARVAPDEGQPIRVAVLQPNIDQDMKWDPAYRDETMNILADLSFLGKREGARLIIWPETATPFYLLESDFDQRLLYDLARETGADILTGTVERKARTRPVRGHKYHRYNAAYLLSPQGRVRGHFAKVRLVPFGEHIPWDSDIPALTQTLFADSGDFTPGPGFTPIRGPGYKLGCFICYEVIFADISRTYARGGADFLVNITNEGWFGQTNEPYQTLAIAAFRAVENRTWLVRAANTGATCFIDPNGRIVRKSKIYIRNQLTDDVYPRRYLTFYTRHGDWFGVGVAGVAGLMVIWTAFAFGRRLWERRRPRPQVSQNQP